MASRGCAEGSDGELLEASEITWYHDPDDTEPIPPTPASAISSSPSQLSASTLDAFFTNVPSAQKVAGSRRSTRIPRPSVRVTDPENAMVRVGSSRKRSASAGPPPRRRICKFVPESDEEEPTMDDGTENEDDDVNEVPDGGIEGNNSQDADEETEYAYTKSLGDADHEARIFLSKYTIHS